MNITMYNIYTLGLLALGIVGVRKLRSYQVLIGMIEVGLFCLWAMLNLGYWWMCNHGNQIVYFD